jgi:HK97 family phage major capsid protein
MARAFVPASIEVLQDAEGIESELARLFADAKNELEVSKFASGSGTNEPTGVVTALSGAANYTAMATDSSFAVGDIFTAIEALPARFRPNAAWQVNLVHINDVMEFGGTSYYTRSGDLASGPSGSILGKPVFENSSSENAEI